MEICTVFLLGKIKDIVNDSKTSEIIITNFLKNLKIRWKRANRNRNYLLNKKKDWLAPKVYEGSLDETRGKCRGRP